MYAFQKKANIESQEYIAFQNSSRQTLSIWSKITLFIGGAKGVEPNTWKTGLSVPIFNKKNLSGMSCKMFQA